MPHRHILVALILCTAWLAVGCYSRSPATASTPSYSVGGSLSGLTGGTVELTLNGGETLSLTADGSFTFPTSLPQGDAYAVTATITPSGFVATVTNGTGTVDAAVTSIVVAITTADFTVGGVVNGLTEPLLLQNNGGDDLTIAQDGPFHFATPVLHGVAYAVTVVSGYTTQRRVLGSATGQVAGANVTDVTIACTDKAWTHPQVEADSISPDASSGYGATVAMASNGDTVMAWIQQTVGGYAILMSERRNGTWVHPTGTADAISPVAASISEVRVAMTPDGDALIAYTMVDGTYWRVYLSESRDGVWTHPASLGDAASAAGMHALGVKVVLAANGDAALAYRGYDGTGNWNAYLSERRSGIWTHPQPSERLSLGGQPAYDPDVAMGDDGDTVVVWYQYDGAAYRTFLSERRDGVWTHPASTASFIGPSVGSASAPRVAMTGSGDALVCWRLQDGQTARLFFSQLRSGVWTHPTDFAEGVSAGATNGISAPQPAIAANGDALLVWQQTSAGTQRIFRSEYHEGVWVHPTQSADAMSLLLNTSQQPRVALGANGDALVSWLQFDGSVWANLRSERRHGTWVHPTSTADRLHFATKHASTTTPAIGANGDAVIVWSGQTSGLDRVYFSEYR